MKPVISIVGRTNVGKSTLYNRLTRTRDAIVDDSAGVTRDRMVGEGKLGDRPYWVVDTGGHEGHKGSEIQGLVVQQFRLALDDSDAVILVVDGREGPCAGDREIVNVLRQASVPVFVAVNKTEGLDPDIALAEFHDLAVGRSTFAISATRGGGVGAMMRSILSEVTPRSAPHEDVAEVRGPKVAVLGRPNVGKSTLVNRLLGEPRMIVSEQAGTTRDSVYIPFCSGGRDYTLVDTAGIRRKARVSGKVEKISVVKTLRALESAHVIILVLDAREGVTEQDAALAGLIRQYGRSMVLAVNKWDGLEPYVKARVRRALKRELPFLDSVRVFFISAKHGSGMGGLMPAVRRAYDSAMADLGTARLNMVLRRAVEAQPPPRVGRRQIKLKYAHQGGKNPPTVVIHGNLVDKVPESYRRYLSSSISRGFRLTGTRVDVWFRTSSNPYLTKQPRAR